MIHSHGEAGEGLVARDGGGGGKETLRRRWADTENDTIFGNLEACPSDALTRAPKIERPQKWSQGTGLGMSI